MRSVAAMLAASLLFGFPQFAGLTTAQGLTEVLVQRVGITVQGESLAVAVTDPTALAEFRRVFWDEPSSSEPERGTTLYFQYFVYLSVGNGPAWESEERYYYAPASVEGTAYFFSVTETRSQFGYPSEWVTRVFHHPDLDQVVLPYAIPTNNTGGTTVGNYPGIYPPSVICSTVQDCPPAAGSSFSLAIPLVVTLSVVSVVAWYAWRRKTKKGDSLNR